MNDCPWVPVCTDQLLSYHPTTKFRSKTRCTEPMRTSGMSSLPHNTTRALCPMQMAKIHLTWPLHTFRPEIASFPQAFDEIFN